MCNVSQKLRICSKPPHTISYFLLNFYGVNLPSCSIYWHKLWYFWHFESQFLHYQPFAQLHVSTCWMRCHRIVRIAFKQVLQVAWVPMRFILQIDWSSNIGESAIDIVVFTSANAPLSIYVLGKRYKVVMVIIMISDMIFIYLLLPLLLILLALYLFYAPINLKLQLPPPSPGQHHQVISPKAFELLKMGLFKFPPHVAKIVFKWPTQFSSKRQRLSSKRPSFSI